MTSEITATLDLVVASLLLRVSPSETDASQRYRECLQRVATAGHPERARLLSLRFELSDRESSVVWLLAANELRADAQRAIGDLTGSVQSTDLSLGQIRMAIYGTDEEWSGLRELSNTGTLRSAGLIECSGTEHESEPRQRWRLSRRLLLWLSGGDELDACLTSIAAVVTEQRVDSDSRIRDIVRSAVATNAIAIVSGAPASGRRTALRAAALEHELGVLEVDCARLSRANGKEAYVLAAIARECRLSSLTPLFRNLDALSTDAVESLSSALQRVHGPILATTGRAPFTVRGERPVLRHELTLPNSSQRATLWLRELGQGTQEDAEFLATQYPLAPALIHHAAKAAKARANGRKMQPDDIYAGIRAVLDDKLGDYAKRVEVTQTWDDLVLPEDQLEAIRYLIARIRQRRTVYEQWGFAAKVGKGLGTSALFSGPPGTGKTMIAALIAKELGLELYQVDMAKIVSKFIGETERNLAGLFDAAEAGHAILLFDEADSLFGKRTDVKSSNDRYANLETNYLLQRLESFTGICLLTSNHESNIDPAFQRRLSLHLRFELPEEDERAALWRAMLPAAAPVAADVDMTSLAKRFVMSGGYIRNAALRAAFLAADEGSEITAQHLERAARLEYEGMGKIAAA